VHLASAQSFFTWTTIRTPISTWVPSGPWWIPARLFRRASDDVYWLSEDDQKNLGYKSPAFKEYLRAECAWDEGLEQEVYAGKRSVDDLKEKLKCRARATQLQARQALLLASKFKESELKPH